MLHRVAPCCTCCSCLLSAIGSCPTSHGHVTKGQGGLAAACLLVGVSPTRQPGSQAARQQAEQLSEIDGVTLPERESVVWVETCVFGGKAAKAARLPSCPAARLPGCPAARLPGCPAAQLPGWPAAKKELTVPAPLVEYTWVIWLLLSLLLLCDKRKNKRIERV